MDVKYNESADDVLFSVKKEIERMDLTIKDFEIDRAHRSGSWYMDRDGKKQQTVLAKFTSWGARNKFFKARKQSKFHIKADLTKNRNDVLNYIRDQLHDTESTASKLVNYVYADVNCNIMCFTKSGRFLKCNSKSEFESVLLYTDNNSLISESIYNTIENDWASRHPGE